jgi:hypothetical protein
MVNHTATQHNLIANVAHARSEVRFSLQHELHGLVLTAADEAADLLNGAAAHIEVIYSNKHIAWFQLACGLSGLVGNEVLDVQIVVNANFEHYTHASVD